MSQVSNVRQLALNELGINTIFDLLNYFPYKYLDLSSTSTILDGKIGENYTVCGKIFDIKEKEPKPDLKLIEISITDNTDTMILAVFKKPWLLKSLNVDDKIAVSGKLEFNYGFKRMTNPIIHKIEKDQSSSDFATIVPTYKTYSKISNSWMINIVKNAIDYIDDIPSFIPEEITKKYKLMNYFEAVKLVHFPSSMQQLVAAKRTVKYGQCFLQQNYWQANCARKNDSHLTSLQIFDKVEDKVMQVLQSSAMYKDTNLQTVLFTKNSDLYAQFDHDSATICNDVASFNKDKFNNLGLVIVDKKPNFTKSELSKIYELSSSCDMLFIDDGPMPQVIEKLIYPDCAIANSSTYDDGSAIVNIYNKELFMAAYEDATNVLKKGGQALIFISQDDFKLDKVTNSMFNGWNLNTISANTKTDVKVDVLKKFEDGQIDVLVCSTPFNFYLKSNKTLSVVVDNTSKWCTKSLCSLKNNLLTNCKHLHLNLISYSKYNVEENRIKNWQNSTNTNELLNSSIFENGILKTCGFDSCGLMYVNLIDNSDDIKIVTTACGDVLNHNYEDNKYLSFAAGLVDK